MTDQTQPVAHAKRLPGFVVERSQAEFDTAKSQAEKLISDAKSEAAKLVQEAQTLRNQQESFLRDLSHSAISQFVDKDGVERHAEIFVLLLRQIQELRVEYDELTPWLTKLVESAIRRIVGDMSSAELIAGIVQQGVADLQTKLGIDLTVHPEMLGELEHASLEFPEILTTVANVHTSPDVPHGTIQLKCDNGEVDISFESRLEAILMFLQEETTNEPSGACEI